LTQIEELSKQKSTLFEKLAEKDKQMEELKLTHIEQLHQKSVEIDKLKYGFNEELTVKNEEASAIKNSNKLREAELLEEHRQKLEHLTNSHAKQFEAINEENTKEKEWYCAKVKKLQDSHDQQAQVLQEQINTNNAKFIKEMNVVNKANIDNLESLKTQHHQVLKKVETQLAIQENGHLEQIETVKKDF
jgi:membrane-bound lytic murein transglycosylase B